jgi:general stress protein 26
MMKTDPQTDAGMQKLADLIVEASIAMLTTEEPDGSLRSRPLATLQMDSEGKLWFFTALSSGKVSEIDQHRKVNLSYANTEKKSYVSVCGSARLFRDRDKMRELWTPWIEPWFPDGLADPDLALLEITVSEAEYWDAPASRAGRLLGLAKALTSGSTEQLGEHGKVHPADKAPAA